MDKHIQWLKDQEAKKNAPPEVFRVGIARKTDGLFLGSMSAQIGMVTTYGEKIVKVNSKSIVVEGKYGVDRVTDRRQIWRSEAIRFGYDCKKGGKQ